jgi:hypothetical protein
LLGLNKCFHTKTKSRPYGNEDKLGHGLNRMDFEVWIKKKQNIKKAKSNLVKETY